MNDLNKLAQVTENNEAIATLNELTTGCRITLATGMGYQVNTVGRSQNFPDLLELTLSRFDRNKNEKVYKKAIYHMDGHYLPTKERSPNDIVRFQNENYEGFLTPVGLSDTETIVDLSQVKLQIPRGLKIRTRNNVWYTVITMYFDAETGMYSLKTESLAGNNNERVNLYFKDGRTQKSSYSDKALYDPYDIVEIQEFSI